MINKKVSVIIPYYKNIKFINKTISSVISQKYQNLEIILIYDDENKDDLLIIKKKFKSRKNLKIINNKKNIGAAKSRNLAMKKAKGYYIAFLDSDDYWKKNKLKKQIEFMQKNNLEMSYTSYDILRNGKFKRVTIQKRYTYKDLVKKCDIGLSTVIIKASILNKGIFPNLKTQEDFSLWLKYFRKKIISQGLNLSLSVWRDTPNSLSSNIKQKLMDAFKVYYKYENKNFFASVYSVLVLSINKIIKNINLR